MRFRLPILIMATLLFTAGCATPQLHGWQVDAPYTDPKSLEVGQIVLQLGDLTRAVRTYGDMVRHNRCLIRRQQAEVGVAEFCR